MSRPGPVRLVKATLALMAVVLVLHVVMPATAAASPAPVASKPGGAATARGGVTISPAMQQVVLDPQKAEQTYDFTVANNTGYELEFALAVVDFGSLDETGGVLFAGNANKTFSYRYTLTPWVQLEKDRVVVAAHGKEKIPVTLLNKESLTPGGHYGAITVTPTDTGGSGKKVQIDQVATSLLFVKKAGGEIYQLSLNRFTVRPHIFALPDRVDLRFQNGGNVHVIPRGLATITDPRGRIVERGVINEDSGIALPETYRQITVRLLPLARAWLPGRYHLDIGYRYDETDTVRTVSTSFIYLNLLAIGAAVLLLAAFLLITLNRRLRRIALTDPGRALAQFVRNLAARLQGHRK
jgi:hypothetical protein